MVDLVAQGLDISKLSAAQQASSCPATCIFADGNRISSWNAKMERLGLTTALQWKPVDNLLLTLDALHGQFTTHRDEMHLATRPLNSDGSVAFDAPAGGVWPAAFQKGRSSTTWRGTATTTSP
jgi:iron complex outermembrane receptor protein